MNVADQAIWEKRSNASTKVMLLSLNSKNNNAKKDLHLLYSQGDKSAYSAKAKTIATYLPTQYPNKTIGH